MSSFFVNFYISFHENVKHNVVFCLPLCLLHNEEHVGIFNNNKLLGFHQSGCCLINLFLYTKKTVTLNPSGCKTIGYDPRNSQRHDFSYDMYIPINVAKGNQDFIDFGINHTDLRIKPHIKRRFI